ncbi:MAG TPA: hypothetical protein VIQ81_12250, partial [Gammaproteobacteria bacterium]
MSADVPGRYSSTTRQQRQHHQETYLRKTPSHSIFGNLRFLRASDRERHFLAYFFFAVEKEVSRQKGE